MPLVVKDRVKVTSTTTGTGTFTLGAAVDGFQSFASIGNTSNGWDTSFLFYDQSFSVYAQVPNPEGLFFKPDGLKMYVTGGVSDNVNEYDLSTAWDVSTATYLQNISISAQVANAQGLFFKPDGLKMYVVDSSGNDVNEYNLSSAWNVTTASYLQNFSVATQEADPFSIFFKPDGLKMYVAGSDERVYEYDLSSAWDISTASYLQNGSVLTVGSNTMGLFFKPDGLSMFVLAGNDQLGYYTLSTAWNVSTISYQSKVTLTTSGGSVTGTDLFFKPDGSLMYVVDDQISDAFVAQYEIGVNTTYYGITSETDWEIGIGVVTSGGSGLYRNTVLGSSNSNALVNWGAGSKDVFCTFPADATEGTVPQGDTSQVGTDLVAWTNLKKELDRTVINGVPYNNNNTAGVVSTFSLVYTTASGSAYVGGVLAPNGDIHFIPLSAIRGQKISATGVVSTYSLVLTAGSKYAGGVLASNGDIHFIKFGAARGQKIDASGVVSTYSLVYTAGGYFGGVLAPNGDVHFIPYDAVVGQKISSAGVVSTYSIIVTNGSGAYKGGVLAANGDIHFVPAYAPVGQKISAAGVVSTYSLVYTTTNAYEGGVLAANGDIHFVPYNTRVGQKVSASGVVSTYSLVYTASGAYSGGVLSPNGDIHFIPQAANRGQKVSAAGVVSTYSLAYTTATAYSGGVLTQTGDIYFIPYYANFGQKISTGTTRNVGYALSPFFNKF
jgi:hypothetical protein